MANGSWRIARARGGARFPLFVVAVLAVVLLLVGKAQSSLFFRVRAEISDWMAPILENTAAPLAGVNRVLGSIADVFSVYEDNLRLKEQNAKLMQWRGRARSLEARIDRYKKLLNAVPDPVLSKVVAQVIGRSNHPFMRTLILNVGKVNDVRPGQAVVDDRGMVGRIFLAGQRTAWVIPLTDINSRIPVAVGAKEAQAIMTGNNSRLPLIENLAHDAEVRDGDPVVTSGDGDILPAGLQIGVVALREGSYRVVLYADQASAQDVEILDYKQVPEQPPQATMQDLPATAAGLPPAVAPPEDKTPSGADSNRKDDASDDNIE